MRFRAARSWAWVRVYDSGSDLLAVFAPKLEDGLSESMNETGEIMPERWQQSNIPCILRRLFE